MNLIPSFLKTPLDWLLDLISEKLRKETEVKLIEEKERRKLADEIISILTEGESIDWKTEPKKKFKKRAFDLANKAEINFNNPRLAYILRHYVNWWSLYVITRFERREDLGHYKEIHSELKQINSDLREEIKNFRIGKKSKHPEVKAKNHK